jgi:hypothetical protein
MAKYKVGAAGGYRLGVQYAPGEVVDIPEGSTQQPSVTWEGMDTEGKAAIAALKADTQAKKDAVATQAAAAAAAAMTAQLLQLNPPPPKPAATPAPAPSEDASRGYDKHSKK